METPPDINALTIEPVSEKRLEEMEKEIDDVAKIFNDFVKPWFMVGGVALDLSVGKFTRDHHDCDVAIYDKDVQAFADYIHRIGYEFFHAPDKESGVATVEEVIAQRQGLSNIHLYKTNERLAGPDKIDLWTLWTDEQTGGVICGDTEDKLVFNKSLFENPVKYKTEKGVEVTLLSKEIIIFYKLIEASYKDYRDIKNFLPTLTAQEKQRLDGYLENINVVFVIAGKEIKDLDELLKVADAISEDTKNKFLNSDEVASNVKERIDPMIEKTFQIATEVDSKEEFRNRVQQEYKESPASTGNETLEKAADFLFSGARHSREEFQKFAYREWLLDSLKKGTLKIPLWKMKTSK